MTTIRYASAFLSLLEFPPPRGEARANDGAPAKFYVPRDGGSRHGGLSAALRARLRRSVEAERGDPEKGSGARVWGLLVVQTQYYDEDLLNEFWLTWSNVYLNPNGLALFANGDPVVYEGTAIPVVLDGTEVETTVFGEGDVGTGLIEFEVVGLNGTASDSIIGLRAAVRRSGSSHVHGRAAEPEDVRVQPPPEYHQHSPAGVLHRHVRRTRNRRHDPGRFQLHLQGHQEGASHGGVARRDQRGWKRLRGRLRGDGV
jgi:hypothetical protein